MSDIPGTRIVCLLDGEMFRVPDNWTDPVDIEAARTYRKILQLQRIVPKFGYWPESKNEDGEVLFDEISGLVHGYKDQS